MYNENEFSFTAINQQVFVLDHDYATNGLFYTENVDGLSLVKFKNRTHERTLYTGMYALPWLY